jgi:hypothetical protein
MKFKHIKEFKEIARNYEYIQHRLQEVYGLSVNKFMLDSFEKSSLFSDDMSDKEYIISFMKHEFGFMDDQENIDETATVNNGNVSGMGAVVTPQAGAVPGTTGTTGSGDIGSGWAKSKENNRNIRSRDTYLPRSRRAQKMKAALKQSTKNFCGTVKTPFDVKQDNTVDTTKKNPQTNIKSFSAFSKQNENYDDDTVARLNPEEIKNLAKGDFNVHPMFSSDKNIYGRNAQNNQNNTDLTQTLYDLKSRVNENGALYMLSKALPKRLSFLKDKTVRFSSNDSDLVDYIQWVKIVEIDKEDFVSFSVKLTYAKATRDHYGDVENHFNLNIDTWINSVYLSSYSEDFKNEAKIFMELNKLAQKAMTYQEVMDILPKIQKLYFKFAGFCINHYHIDL